MPQQTIEPDPTELTTIERVAKLTWWFCQGDAMSAADAAKVAGVSPRQARRILMAMARVVPIYCNCGTWEVCALQETVI